MASSTIDKKLEIEKNLEIKLEIDKNLENKLENYKKNIENIVEEKTSKISSFLSMVDELYISIFKLFYSYQRILFLYTW